MRWIRKPQEGGSLDETTSEWDEHWTVIGHGPPAGEPAWIGLLEDRPQFRHGRPHYTPGVLAKVANFQHDRLASVDDAWEVVVSYRQTLEEEEVNPLDRPAEIDLDSESVEVPIDRDADGKPLLSSAGGLIAGLTEEESRWIFNYSKNIPAMPRWLLDYRNASNSDAVRIGGLTIDPGYLLLKNPRAGKPQTAVVGERTIEYRELTFSLIYNPKTWITRFYDRDLFELTEDGKERVRITAKTSDGGEEPIDEPAFLDGKGRRPRIPDPDAEPDENGERPLIVKHPLSPEDIVTIERWTKKRLPFRRLPLT